MKKTGLIIALFFGLAIAQAHEFWLQPKKYRYALGEEMRVDFMVGENFTGEFWDLARHKVEKIDVYNEIAARNLLKQVNTSAGNNVTYRFDRQGTHLLALESNFAFIELEGSKFNDYLKEDGIENILDERTKSNNLDKPSREYYKRYAKVLVQCGDRLDETYRRKVGFRYEIIPLANPYSIKSGDYLDCQVLWEGKPVPHSMVKVWSLVGNRIFLQNIYTENDGTIRFPISSTGRWMVSSVKMIASEKEEGAYQSQWTSLVFGIQ